MLLEKLTKELRALKDLNLKSLSITGDLVSIFTRKSHVVEIDIKDLKEKEAIKKVVDKVSKDKKNEKK